MSGRGGGGAGGNGQKGSNGISTIPAVARKMVQSLKEIVNNCTELEIYAALKDCNMDPNEAVNRLLSQGPIFSTSLQGYFSNFSSSFSSFVFTGIVLFLAFVYYWENERRGRK